MLQVFGSGTRLCDGIHRREFLRVGGLALGGLSLPSLLRAKPQAARTRPTRAKSVIQLYMWGGPSQLETFDLKPNAPDGIRGDFRPIDTRVPGVRICEHLPRLAQMTDRFAILRSVTHTGTNHGTSAYHMLTGHIHFAPGTLRHPSPNDYPSIGCAVGKYGRQPKDMPAYVALPGVIVDGDGGEVPGQGPGLLGQRWAPFRVEGDPSRSDFSIDTLTLPEDFSRRRLGERIRLQAALDRQADRLARLPEAAQMDSHYERAFRLLQSEQAQRAFNLASEPEKVRERFGGHYFGQSCILARRLVEAGVPLVTVYWGRGAPGAPGNWDTHGNNCETMKNSLLPVFEQAYTALLEDLQQRGLLDETLVMWFGEFGRTPRINKNAGRDHWGNCQSVLMAGAGVRGGQVYGSSDGSAAYAAELPVSPDDLAATVFDSLGVNLDQEIHDAQGRPLPLCRGKPILGLF
jgi:hypothetical protein